MKNLEVSEWEWLSAYGVIWSSTESWRFRECLGDVWLEDVGVGCDWGSRNVVVLEQPWQADPSKARLAVQALGAELHQTREARLTLVGAAHNQTGWNHQVIHCVFWAGMGSSWTGIQVMHLPCEASRKVRLVSESASWGWYMLFCVAWTVETSLTTQNTCLIRFKPSVFSHQCFYSCIPWIQGLCFLLLLKDC